MYIRTHVSFKSRSDRIIPVENAAHVYQVYLKEEGDHNKANKQIRQMLADYYHVMLGRIKLVTGHNSSLKIYDLEEERSRNSFWKGKRFGR